MRIARALVGPVVLAAVVAVGGCGEATTHSASTGAGPGAGASPTLPALRTKLAALSGDECATQAADQAYPVCARFVREVQNVVPAARAESGSVASAATLTTAADATDGAVNRLAQDDCVAGAGAPDGDPATCATDFTSLQEGFRALVAAVG